MEEELRKEIQSITFSAKKAAKYLGVSYQTILTMARRKVDPLPHIKFGSIFLFRKEDLDKWMKEHTGEEAEGKGRVILDKQREIELELICRKLKNSITIGDILNWLDNFEEKDQPYAIKVLDSIEYFNDKDILEAYKYCLNELQRMIGSTTTIYFNPVKEYGKSASAMAYFLKKALDEVNMPNKISFIVDAKFEFKLLLKSNKIPQDTAIVIFDDFYGSGKSLYKHYAHEIEQQFASTKVKPRIFFMSIVLMERAIRYMMRKCKGISEENFIYFRQANKLFERHNTILRNKHRIEIREMCYRYAEDKKLCLMTDNNTGKSKNHPLGYENCQGTIVFSIGTPNNTLPIIWSGMNKWKPLYPRMTDMRIDQSRKFRKGVAYDLAKAYNLGADMLIEESVKHKWKTKCLIDKTNFQLFAILKLIRERRSKPIICNLLGIFENDYEDLINTAKEKGILDIDGSFTVDGLKMYNEILKKIHSLKEEKDTRNITEYTPIMYLPKTFRGKH